MNCKNHPDKEAVKKCSSCGEEFCSDCLSKYQEKDYCGPCLKAEVAVATARLGGNARELARMKKSLIGCSAVLLVVVLTPMILLIYPCLKLGDVGRCRSNLKEIYGALKAYAKENDGWFPEENNDLRPILAGDYLKKKEVFQCPGAGRVGGSVSSGRRFPPDMSYLYQGGLRLPGKREAPKALMWDRSPRNHRGKGINVLYTDGTVKFRTKRLSEVRLRKIDPDTW